jgi:hypothetical protein
MGLALGKSGKIESAIENVFATGNLPGVADLGMQQSTGKKKIQLTLFCGNYFHVYSQDLASWLKTLIVCDICPTFVLFIEALLLWIPEVLKCVSSDRMRGDFCVPFTLLMAHLVDCSTTCPPHVV